MKKLKAPFPYFGGKSRWVDTVWGYLGKPDVYVEPFAGTAVMLLQSPQVHKREVICDLNGFICKFLAGYPARSRTNGALGRLSDYPPGFDSAAQVADCVGQRTQCEAVRRSRMVRCQSRRVVGVGRKYLDRVGLVQRSHGQDTNIAKHTRWGWTQQPKFIIVSNTNGERQCNRFWS